tara:strand:- start:27020 stop:27184 length:165 start_codon:yes stop_codon:yes gene_type:complete
MKTLKITLILAVLFATFTSCTQQDLNEDTVLVTPANDTTAFTGGIIDGGGKVTD